MSNEKNSVEALVIREMGLLFTVRVRWKERGDERGLPHSPLELRTWNLE